MWVVENMYSWRTRTNLPGNFILVGVEIFQGAAAKVHDFSLDAVWRRGWGAYERMSVEA